MLATPIAAAPSTSPWMAMRFRSRQATCMHRRVAHAGQQRADADRRHVAVGARRIDGVDRVHPAVEYRGAVVDLLRVGGIGRVQLRRHGELAAPEHALQPPARRMAGQRIERQVHAGGVDVAVGVTPSPSRSAAACAVSRSHAEVSRSE